MPGPGPAGNWTRRSVVKGLLAGAVGAGVGVGVGVALEGISSSEYQKQGMRAWSDEFNGPSGASPDPAFWSAVTNGARSNRELQYYVPSANALDGQGNLIITAKRDNGAHLAWYGPSLFTSGKVWTQRKLAFRYGHLEVRAAFPCAGRPGAWPAIWLLGTNVNQVGWPACGEIDVFESFGKKLSSTRIWAHVHTSAGSRAQSTELDPANDVTKFHVYTLDWEPTSIEIGVDAQTYFAVKKSDLSVWPFSQPFFLILNLAIGGFGGGYVPATAAFPYLAQIDYVRFHGGELYRTTGAIS